MRRQQSCAELGELSLETHALLDEARDQGGFLHIGKRLTAAVRSNRARLLGPCERLRLGR